jgi:hypothetical protein
VFDDDYLENLNEGSWLFTEEESDEDLDEIYKKEKQRQQDRCAKNIKDSVSMIQKEQAYNQF